MNWFQQNRWLGRFLIGFGVCTVAAIYFLYSARSSSNEALARFNEATSERNRLENLDPFPNEPNYRKVKSYLDGYGAALETLKENLKTRVLPAPVVLAPNEFQSLLRESMLAIGGKARENRVKLPENFALGFEEYTAALPNTVAAPLLGQQLSQVKLLLNMLIEARVDGVTALIRTPLPEEHGATPATTPVATGPRKPATPASTPAGPRMLERSPIDITFASTPSAARKVLNQISSSSQQFYIIRTLYVRNEKDKGPAREQPAQAQAGAGAIATPTPAKPPSNTAISFIVGNEHIETSARIELIRFTF
jgi:hypothetical protein